jgi:hypothetical protein
MAAKAELKRLKAMGRFRPDKIVKKDSDEEEEDESEESEEDMEVGGNA